MLCVINFVVNANKILVAVMMEIEALFVSLGLAVALHYVNVQSIFLPVLVCGILITFLK